MELFLTLLSGICWIIVYEECIRLAFSQKTYAMPFWALGLHVAWEAIYTYSDLFLGAHGPLTGMTLAQTVANAAWVCLDILILTTYFRFGKKEWPKKLDSKLFAPWSVLVLVCCFALQLVFIKEFGFEMAAQYSAFLQNLLMSVLFIGMYVKRGGMEGQSLLLAVAKWIGTLAPTILMGVITFNWVVLVTGVFCSVFDLIYIALLQKERHKAAQ
ncbi:MAG: hypothetical protein IJV59_05285 [Eubacterium sp.]|nr:hypothetical protein [Eubacterium sp.]